jgi:hypothetical protein
VDLSHNAWIQRRPTNGHEVYKTRRVFVFAIPYRGADKFLARSTSLSIIFSVQGKGGSPMGQDPENRVGDQDIGSPGRPVSSGLQVPGEPFPSWLG